MNPSCGGDVIPGSEVTPGCEVPTGTNIPADDNGISDGDATADGADGGATPDGDIFGSDGIALGDNLRGCESRFFPWRCKYAIYPNQNEDPGRALQKGGGGGKNVRK